MKYYHIGIDILGILIVTIFSIFIYIHKNQKYETSKIFLVFLVLVSGSLLSDMIGYMFLGSSDKMWLIKITYIINYVFSSLLLYTFLLYILSYLKKNTVNKFVFYFSLIVLLIQIVLILVNIFVPIYFEIENGIYSISATHYICDIVYYYFSAMCLLFSLFASGLKKRVRILLLIYLAILIASSIISKAIPDFSLRSMALIVCIVIMFNGAFMERGDIIQQQRVDIQNAQIELMLSQIKPHFIYNALTAIQMIDGNPQKTKDAIGNFARYLRTNLTNFNERGINTFKQELDIVKTYLKIEKLRFGDELKTEFNIDTENFSLPNMCLQVIVENAVKHGISRKRGGGTLKISTNEDDENIYVVVEDDGVGFDTSVEFDKTHVGIRNIRNRLSFIVKGTLDIQSKIGSGTKVTITIPKNSWKIFVWYHKNEVKIILLKKINFLKKILLLQNL